MVNFYVAPPARFPAGFTRPKGSDPYSFVQQPLDIAEIRGGAAEVRRLEL